MKISAVLPTRGDVDLSPIVERIRKYAEVTEIIITIGDTPYNRYRGARQAANDIIYTQDDDCITDLRPLIEAYRPGVLVNAMTPSHAKGYQGDETLVGFGSLFHKSLLAVFDGWEEDALFLSKSDRVFGTLVPHHTVFPEITILPCAYNPNRLYLQPDHGANIVAMRERIATFRKNHETT